MHVCKNCLWYNDALKDGYPICKAPKFTKIDKITGDRTYNLCLEIRGNDKNRISNYCSGFDELEN